LSTTFFSHDKSAPASRFLVLARQQHFPLTTNQHLKDQHFHGDEILESSVEGLVVNSLAVERLEIWEENCHMVGGFLEDQKN